MKRKSKSERERERIEERELVRRVRAREDVILGDGQLAPVPDIERAPCEIHNPDWSPVSGPRGQRPPTSLCGECIAERNEERRRARSRMSDDPVEVPPYRAASGPMSEAWANYRADHKDEFIARGACAVVDKELERRVIDKIDDARWDELADLTESPTLSKKFKTRMKRHRKYWRRNY